MRALLALVLPGLLLTGCGAAAPTTGAGPADVGKAADVLECTAGRGPSGSGNHDTGPEAPGDDVDAALASFLDAEAVAYALPTEGYAVAADGGRALVTLDVAGRPVVALVLADDTSGQGRTGWGVRSWAACDLADLPPALARSYGIDVWTDADGDRVPTARVQSSPGPAHCDWQDLTFLHVGADTYVRDPDGELAEASDGRFDASAAVPDSARDTGWQHEGRRLWLTPDAAYVVTGDATERWPRVRVGCA